MAAGHSQHTMFQEYIIPVWQAETVCCLEVISANTFYLPSNTPIKPFYSKGYKNVHILSKALKGNQGCYRGYLASNMVMHCCSHYFYIVAYTAVHTCAFPILGKSIRRNGNIPFQK